MANIPLAQIPHFVYYQTMNVESRTDEAASRIAAAIGEPARARILYCLMDNRARTATELAVIAEVSASTASVHLDRLRKERLVNVTAQGKHRYYSLEGPGVAKVLEGLSVLAGGARAKFVPHTPHRMRAARTCYDHLAGNLGVSLHDRMMAMGWLAAHAAGNGCAYDVTPVGIRALQTLGIDIAEMCAVRRKFAFACLDWSERRSHLGGALGAVLLKVALRNKWVAQELDSRALQVTSLGQREMRRCFGVAI